jgi:ThiF family
MRLSPAQDRQVQLLLGADPGLDFDAARQRLERAALVVSAGDASRLPWGQAALLTIVECAVRMFRGGVHVVGGFSDPVIVGNRPPVPLRAALIGAGCRNVAAPAHAIAIYVGADLSAPANAIRCWADGWVATASPRAPDAELLEGNEISGALAGAMAASEAFRAAVLNDVRGGKRTLRLSPLDPADPQPAGTPLEHLPGRCWVLGLGNLGQAVLWFLGLLPYRDPGSVQLFLQDVDVVGPENLDVQILARPAWIGRKKARAAAEWAEDRGFRTSIIEQRFTDTSRRGKDEPGLAFVGVDNLPTRRAAASTAASFDLILDGGLGATSAEVFDIRVHGFPGNRDPISAWPDPPPPRDRPLSGALTQLVEAGRLDLCGAMTIAGQPAGVPTTAVAAAAIEIAQACRAIETGSFCDLVDLSLLDPKRVATHQTTLARVGVLPTASARRL